MTSPALVRHSSAHEAERPTEKTSTDKPDSPGSELEGFAGHDFRLRPPDRHDRVFESTGRSLRRVSDKGSRAPVVLLSCVCPWRLGFLENPRRLSVAITWAQEQLAIFVNPSSVSMHPRAVKVFAARDLLFLGASTLGRMMLGLGSVGAWRRG
eukprot:TRINITY_DN77111_c0_g1_i1.p2 TRINITY_DN77111_c0_g1~~TRINITY_DN77111_c0_g1_i1.p2  ORF type:complete len:153 (+),score=9.90 TRINITY_DN77111_c0_g1_i1:2-460(+)